MASALELLNLKNLYQWSKTELQSLQNFALLLGLLPEVDGWSNRDKQSIVSMIREKGGGSEPKYISGFQQQRRLNNSLKELLKVI
jgi:hypothetical protein